MSSFATDRIRMLHGIARNDFEEGKEVNEKRRIKTEYQITFLIIFADFLVHGIYLLDINLLVVTVITISKVPCKPHQKVKKNLDADGTRTHSLCHRKALYQ